MSTGKRGSSKRSVMGSRVAAKKEATGLYEPATITSVEGETTSTVVRSSTQKIGLTFDDGSKGCFAERHIIGPGFQSITSASLTTDQIVYCTVGHREMSGKIRALPAAGSDLFQIALDDNNGQFISNKIEDLRLIKSRKSSRQIADKDYLSLASGKSDVVQETENVKEPPTTKPTTTTTSRKRAMPLDIVNAGSERVKSSHSLKVGKTKTPALPRSPKSLDRESIEDELPYMPMEDGESEDGDARSDSLVPEDDDEESDELMDECSAALVLMSLSNSPAMRAGCTAGVPTTRKPIDQQEDAGFSSSSVPNGGLYGSSWPVSGGSNMADGRRRSARRAYANSMKEWRMASSSDEGIEVGSVSGSSQLDAVCMLDHDYSLGTVSSESTQDSPMEPYTFQATRKQRPSTSNMVMMFECTWPECYHMESSRNSIKRHIQNVHFTSAGLRSEDLDFYYNEVETIAYSSDVSDSLSTPSTPPSVEKEMTGSSSSSHVLTSNTASDRPAYGTRHRQRSTMSCSSDASTTNFSRSSKYASSSAGISIPRSSKLRRHYNEWQSASAPQADKYGDMASPPGSSSHLSKKMRDIKKCRKVYGMENREQWCTQCKWKKACTRFAHENQ